MAGMEPQAGKKLSPKFQALAQRKLLISTLCALFLPLLLVAPQVLLQAQRAEAQSPEKLKAHDEEIRQQMLVMSRQLGVTCTTCHKTENFVSDELPAFKVSKEHIKLVQALIDAGLDGGKKGHPKADCYLCHRGKLVPDFKEVLDPLRKEPVKKKSEHKEDLPANSDSESEGKNEKK